MNPLSETLFPVTEVPAIGVPEGVDEKEIDSTGYKFITRFYNIRFCISN